MSDRIALPRGVQQSKSGGSPARRRLLPALLVMAAGAIFSAGLMANQITAHVRKITRSPDEGVTVTLRFEGQHLVDVLENNLRVSDGVYLPSGIQIDGDTTTAVALHVPLDTAVRLLINADLLTEELRDDSHFVMPPPRQG